MPDVHQAPSGGKGGDPPTALPIAAPTLDLRDRDAVRAWLADLRTQIDDVAAAGEDATRSLSRRALGRPTARRAIIEGRRSLEHLLLAAERGLESADSGT